MSEDNLKTDYIIQIEQKIMQLTPENRKLASLFLDAAKNDNKPMQELLWAIARGEADIDLARDHQEGRSNGQ